LRTVAACELGQRSQAVVLPRKQRKARVRVLQLLNGMSTIRNVLSSAFLISVGAACFTPSDPGPPSSDPSGSQAVPACPHLQIKAPDSVPAGTQAPVSVSVVGAQVAPTFTWKVKGGAISSGQGSSNIVIDTTGSAGATVFASVELGGLPPECATKAASANFLVGPAVATTSR